MLFCVEQFIYETSLKCTQGQKLSWALTRVFRISGHFWKFYIIKYTKVFSHMDTFLHLNKIINRAIFKGNNLFLLFLSPTNNKTYYFFLFWSCEHFSYFEYAKVFYAKFVPKIAKRESFCKRFRFFDTRKLMPANVSAPKV